MKHPVFLLCLALVFCCTACAPDTSPGTESSASAPSASVESAAASGAVRAPMMLEDDSTRIIPPTPQPFTLEQLLCDPLDATFMIPETDDYVVVQFEMNAGAIDATVLYSYDERGDVVGVTSKMRCESADEAATHLAQLATAPRLMADEGGWTREDQSFALVGELLYERTFPFDILKDDHNYNYKGSFFAQCYDKKTQTWSAVEDTRLLSYYFSIPSIRNDYEEIEHPNWSIDLLLEPMKIYDTLDDFENLPTDDAYHFAPAGEDYVRVCWLAYDTSQGKVKDDNFYTFDTDGMTISRSTRIEFTDAGSAAAFVSSITTGPDPGVNQAGNYVYIYDPAPAQTSTDTKAYYMQFGSEMYLDRAQFYMSQPSLTPQQLARAKEEGIF